MNGISYAGWDRERLLGGLADLNDGILRLGGRVRVTLETAQALTDDDLRVVVEDMSHLIRQLTDLAK